MKEEQIRPKKEFDKFLELLQKDCLKYFKNSELLKTKCPACDAETQESFIKDNFTYHECEKCNTLFVNPRPPAESFSKFYTESESSRFFSSFYEATEESRREKLWKPKAKLIKDIMDKYSCSNSQIIDIGGGYGVFAEEMQKISNIKPLIIEPGPELASICRSKSFDVIESFLEDVECSDLPKGPKVFVSFELFEHLHSANQFLKTLSKLMGEEDLFIFTTLSSTGLDILELWENSNAICPPQHINFFNPYSIKLLLKKEGFDPLSITTPGKLDIDILKNNKSNIKSNSWKYLIRNLSNDEIEQLQELITKSNMSSHMMVTCKKQNK